MSPIVQLIADHGLTCPILAAGESPMVWVCVGLAIWLVCAVGNKGKSSTRSPRASQQISSRADSAGPDRRTCQRCQIPHPRQARFCRRCGSTL